MELKKDLKINIYEVIADYKVKTENSSFIAILQFAEENGGIIDSIKLQNELLAPLSKKACDNLLERLTKMGYFEITEETYYKSVAEIILDKYKKRNNFSTSREQNRYKLTNLGYESAQKEEFYDKRNGLLKLYVVEGIRFIEQKIIKIEESNRDFDENTKVVKLTEKLDNLQNSENIIKLKNGSFILDKFQPKCKILKDKTEQLTLIANKHNSIVKILDFENIESFNEQKVKIELLKNEFAHNYLPEYQMLKVDFDTNNLQLQKNIIIDKPQLGQTVFNSININNIKVSPKTFEDAKTWHSALLKQQINQYFLSDKEFIEFSNQIANKFELYNYELQNIQTRREFAEKLNKKTDFYKKAKLETINYLSY